MNEYPTLHFVVRWGRPIAIAIAVLTAGAGLWGTIAGGSAIWAVLGVGAGAIGYGLLMSYVELLQLVMDMLLPK